MLLNKKQVKAYVKGLNKRISPDAIRCLDERLATILTRAARNSNQFKTIRRDEILLTK